MCLERGQEDLQGAQGLEAFEGSFGHMADGVVTQTEGLKVSQHGQAALTQAGQAVVGQVPGGGRREGGREGGRGGSGLGRAQSGGSHLFLLRFSANSPPPHTFDSSPVVAVVQAGSITGMCEPQAT